MMHIEFLKAGTGDSIWISQNKKNIVIDGGKSAAAVKERYLQMPQDESIDLLIVTHIDTDHIAGIIALVKMMKTKDELHRLKQVWFNFPKKKANGEYSVTEGNELSSLFCEIAELSWNNNTSELIGNPISIGEMRIHVLAPNHDVAYEYLPKRPEELSMEYADWDVELKTLIENVDDDDLAEGGPNSQSIVIIVESEGKKLLLPGDCTPQELNDALCAYNSKEGKPVKIDLMKLPHHGSRRNLTKSILEEIECSNFMISTNVNKKYCFPHKETIAKLICYKNEANNFININFNYKETLDVLCITEKEQSDNRVVTKFNHDFYL